MNRNLLAVLSATIAMSAAATAEAFTLSPFQAIPVAEVPNEVAIGDVNGDGRNDVVLTTLGVLDSPFSKCVFVYLQNAQGGLDTPQSVSYLPSDQTNASSLALADMNNDGRMDAIVGHDYGISVLLAQPDGSLALTNQYPGYPSYVLAVSDVNLDGNTDVAAMHDYEYLSVYLGDGHGEISGHNILDTLGVGGDIEFGDFNGDGFNDLAISSRVTGDNRLAVHYHDTVSALGPAVTVPVSGDSDANGLAAGDFNGDGRTDLVMSRQFPYSEASILLQDSLGQIAEGLPMSSYENAGPAVAGDLDGDGDDDLVIAHSGMQNIGVYFQTGAGLAPESLYPMPVFNHFQNSVAIGDINSDGCRDLVALGFFDGLLLSYGQDCFVADSVPNHFSFPSQIEVPPNSLRESISVVIEGTNVATPISVSNGEYRVDDGAYTSAPGLVNSGQAVQVRHTSANSYATATTTSLNVGGITGTFTSTTVINDTVPNQFSFTDQSGLPTNVITTSNVVTVNGINAPTPISISGGMYSVNSGAFTNAAGTVQNGNTVQVRVTTSASANTAVNTTLTVGGISDTFTATTGAGDSTPDGFDLVDHSGVKKMQWVTANVITVSGINLVVNAAVSGTNIRWSKNGGTYTTGVGTVQNGDQIRVQMKAASAPLTAVTGSLTVGGITDFWTVTTRGN